jgi:predicted AlkP superfamily phosphohydrolase/phosphomutase
MKLRLRRLLAWVSLLLFLAWTGPSRAGAPTSAKAIVVGWDGAVPSFVRELVQQGQLPNLAKLIDDGAFADDVMSTFPSKTAPGFASLWTGAPPRVHGISGNRIPREPRSDQTVLESTSAFLAARLLAEPIWASARSAGRKVVLSHVPLGRERSDNIVKFLGYDTLSGRDGVLTSRTVKPRPASSWVNLPATNASPLEIQFTVGSSFFLGLFIDDPDDEQDGYDTLILAGAADGRDVKARIKSSPPGPGSELFWTGPIDVQTIDNHAGATYLRLFDLRPDASDFFLYFTRPARDVILHPESPASSRTTAGTFIGNGASLLYNQGAFGPTIPKGGEGLAEARYIETVRFAQHQLLETNRWALENVPWDLFLAYTPFPDESEHLWRGYLEPDLPGFRQEVAERLRPFLADVYRACDELLGLFMKHRPENTIIAVVSDHGMEGVSRLVAINRLLQRDGLLMTDEQGRVDLTKTKVLYPSINNGYLLMNTTDRKNGIVKPEERAEIVCRVRDLLLGIRDSDRQVVTAVYDAESDGEAMGIGGRSGGDIYLDLAAGYDFDAKTGAGDFVLQREPIGNHGFNPARPLMRTIMVFNGPGIKSGQRLGDARLTDFAPTLSKLLEIRAPGGATGRVLEEALTSPH